MKYLSILNSSFAGALVAGCFTMLLDSCLAVAINDEGFPLSVSLPFNDLLPPLSDVDFEKEKTPSSVNAASTVTPTDISKTTRRPPAIPAPVVKPTKSLKNVQAKKLQQKKNKQQQLKEAAPILDLNPKVPPVLHATEKVVATVKVPELKQAASVQHTQLRPLAANTAQTEYETQQQQSSKPQKRLKQQQNQSEFVKHLQQQTVVHHKLQSQKMVAINKAAQTKALISQVQREGSFEQLQQSLHPTTSRPSRGALPTLTPFPRRLK